MLEQYSTRREFLKYGKLSLLLLLNSCSNLSKKTTIYFQSSFYPDSLKDSFPLGWEKENINFAEIELDKNNNKLIKTDFTLINDGWINSLNFEEFNNINSLFPSNKLDRRSKEFLKNFEDYQRNKLFPVGVVPYVVIIKNNKDLVNAANQSWDFLLSKKLTGKIIFPQSPRIIISIAKKISGKNSLGKLKEQAMLYEDQNSLNWLINSDACVAILPYSLCSKYFKIDSRLSTVFPKKGVPLMWHFILSKSKINTEFLIEWIKSLENKDIIDKLANQGWYLPFNNIYAQSKYSPKNYGGGLIGPSNICWKNSWSFPPIVDKQKINLDSLWNESLTP